MSSLTLKARRANQYGALRKQVAALKKIASGEAIAAATEAAGKVLRARAEAKIDDHSDTGKAAEVFFVDTGDHGIRSQSIAYLHFHPWWPLKKGMPPYVLSILRARLKEALSAKG